MGWGSGGNTGGPGTDRAGRVHYTGSMKIELTPDARRALRAQAHHIDPVVMIGNDGLTPSVLHEVDVNLMAHGLIKIRVFSDDRDARDAMLEQIADELEAAPVQHIGKLLVVYRPLPEEETVAPRKPAGGSARKSAPRNRGGDERGIGDGRKRAGAGGRAVNRGRRGTGWPWRSESRGHRCPRRGQGAAPGRTFGARQIAMSIAMHPARWIAACCLLALSAMAVALPPNVEMSKPCAASRNTA